MVELLVGASLISAFIAGIAALFAPCCITVLLPAYLGSVFRQRRTIFLMTFVFFLGLLTVFLPLGLGVAALGELFTQYHNVIFIAGGLFLLLLGVSIMVGRHFSLPFTIPLRMGENSNSGSIFTLGVFSGFATLCCAPVLAGVLALAILPGSVFWGGVYSLAYVLGMVSPLFIIASFLDKTNSANRFMLLKKRVKYPLAGKEVNIAVADVLSGVTFLLMGIFILYLAQTGQLAMRSEYQTTVNIYMANLNTSINQYVAQIPAAIWVIVIIAALALIIRTVLKSRRQSS